MNWKLREKLGSMFLVEWMIVLAILTILAAMIVPVFVRIKNQNESIRRNGAATTLHIGDKVNIIGLDVRGVVDRTFGSTATIIVVGKDGFPVKMEVNRTIIRKSN